MADEQSKVLTWGEKRIKLLDVAKAQKLLLIMVTIQVALYVAMIAVMGEPLISGVLALLWLIAAVTAIVQTVRLSLASGGNIVLAVIGGLAMLFPVLGLLLMLGVNSRATTLLKVAGVPVGMLGVSASNMARLRAGTCAHCGYDLKGIEKTTCPECGKTPQLPVVS